MRLSSLALAILGGLAGCTHSGDGPTSAGTASAGLTLLPNCAAAERGIKQMAIAAMNQELDASWKSYISGTSACIADAEASSAGSSDAGPSQVSSTNNQVAGVDEADFVKNDNQYIYTLAHGALQIVQAWPASNMHLLSRTPIDGTPLRLFVEQQRALVYTALGTASYAGYAGCTYGYDCDVASNGTSTRLLIFDLSDITQPTLLRQIDLSGSFIAARRIGDAVHTVVANGDAVFPYLPSWPDGYSACGTNLPPGPWALRAWNALRQQNADAINKTSLAGMFPSLKDSLGATQAADCANTYAAGSQDGGAFTSIVSLDMMSDAAPSMTTVVSRPGFVYVASDSLYITTRHAGSRYGWAFGGTAPPEVSTVHKFTLGATPEATAYAASGIVGGHALSQYALDEWQGNLRVATSSSWVPDPNVTSQVDILAQQGGDLVPVGHVGGIAPQEDIRAVRFDGPRGYLVTFKKTDPLYVLDLSQAQAPAVLGELQIPGFSTYMHLMDDQHLLTIGYDADDEGSFAWFSGILLQIFDVSNPAAPQRLFVQSLGTRGSSSEALGDPLAFNYFAPQNLLALPITLCEGGSPGTYGTDMTFSGLIVYDVTTANGFRELGRIAHPNDGGSGYNNDLCMHWWADPSSEVKRSVIMDSFINSISQDAIKVGERDNLVSVLATVSLQ